MHRIHVFVVIIWIVDVVCSDRQHLIHAFQVMDTAVTCTVQQLRRQQRTLTPGRSTPIEMFPNMNYPFTIHSNIIQQSLPRYRQSQRDRSKNRWNAIHEPRSDITSSSESSSSSLSHWSPSLFFQSLRIKDRHQLYSMIRATVIIGLSSYYFYKGLYSISSSVNFWKAEGDLLLKPFSVATWSAELIG
jgi:hypothetical protein